MIFLTGATGYMGRRLTAELLRRGHEVTERIPKTRDAARRLGLVTLKQMVTALADSVDHPAGGVSVVTVPEIKSGDFCRP